VKKSGNAAFDRAIEQAIERARPLPVPSDAGVYPQFRDQRLVFTGER
jgi:outer membrane biosynthesis protein TonB